MHKQALTRIEIEVGGPGAQLSKRTSKIESFHSEEATPECWTSRQSGKEKAIFETGQ